MSLIERLLLESDNESNFNGICSTIASDIGSRKTTLLVVIENSETLLTSPDLEKHKTGLNVLSGVLELLPTSLLSTKELEFVAQFLCGQVKQHHSFLSPALRGLAALVQHPELSWESLHNITTTLFNHVVWQTQILGDRKNFYTLLQYITFNRIEDYKSVSSEFLFSVISSVDGERDPRNLLLLFSFLPRLYTSIPLGPLAEDAFEVVSCYFPVDLHSSGAEPGAVTRQDLVSALTSCLLAVPEFATFCIPLIQEKLESSLKSAKIDSYNLLVEGCNVWAVEFLVPYCEVLWSAVRQDTLPPRDAQVADCATHALQALVSATREPALTPFLQTVIRSCEGFLSDVQLSLFEPATRLLLAAMQASSAACDIVSSKLLPGLVCLLQVTPDSIQVPVLNKLTAFIKVCLLNNPDLDSGRDGWSGLYGELCSCVAQGSTEVRQAAYVALSYVARHLDADCRARLYPCILSQVTSQPPIPLRSACVKCLQALAVIHGDEVQTNIVDHLTVQQGSETVRNQIETVCSLAVVDRFHPVLEQQFTSFTAQGSLHCSVAISCLRNILEEEEVCSNGSLVHFLFSQSAVLPTLIKLNCEGNDLLNSARIIQTLVRLQTSGEQIRVVQPLAQALLQHPSKTHQMVLLEALLGALWPDISVLSTEDISQVVIPAALLSSDSTLVRTSALQLLSSLINKASDDNLLDIVCQRLHHCPPLQAVTVSAYVTKALVLRGHPSMEHWLNKLVDLLDSEEVGESAAEGVQLIVEESQLFLNHQNHCLVKLLYRQRLFHLIVPRLVQGAREVQHLKAMAYLLQAVPSTVYVHHIKQIMPLLVKSLDTECEGLLLTVLRTLASLLAADHSCCEEQVDTFIPRFLHLARTSRFMRVRIAALQCLESSLEFSPIVLLPHKQQVVTELLGCLDDKKRLVRREAARTRAKWFLLGAPSPES